MRGNVPVWFGSAPLEDVATTGDPPDDQAQGTELGPQLRHQRANRRSRSLGTGQLVETGDEIIVADDLVELLRQRPGQVAIDRCKLENPAPEVEASLVVDPWWQVV